MATVTHVLAEVSDAQEPPHYATLSYDYDDATLLITAITVANDTNQAAHVQAARTDASKTYSATVPAGQTQSITIRTNQANRLQLTVTPSGKLDGVDWQFWLV